MSAQHLSAPTVSAAHRIVAWSVHASTATGAVAAFAATLAVFDERYRAAFFLLVAATVIDGTDGVLARLARWNIVAVYLHAAGLARGLNAAILLVLSVLVFVRIGYVYSTRTPVLRGLTIALGAVWGLMILGMIAMMPDVPGLLVIVSLFCPVYYTVLSFTLHARRGLRA